MATANVGQLPLNDPTLNLDNDMVLVRQPGVTGKKTRRMSLRTIKDLNSHDLATALTNSANALSTANTAGTSASDALNLATASQSAAAAAASLASTASANAMNAVSTANSAAAAAAAAIPVSEKGVALGVATLGADGKVPASQLPISGAAYKGQWNASTNSPALSDGTGVAGDWYFVATGATRNLGSGNVAWTAGAMAIHNGSIWVENEATNTIISVNGKVGAIILDTNDIADVLNKRYVTDPILAALSGTNGTPSSTNKFVTDSDPRLQAAGSVTNVTVSGGFLDISFVEDTVNKSGDGTLRLLNTLTNPATGVKYTNQSAGTKFPRTLAKWGAIDVTTATYDDVCLQELFLQIEGNATCVSCVGRRFIVNLPNGAITIPAGSLIGSNINTFKVQDFLIDGGLSSIKLNGSATNKIFFKRAAISLADANSNMVSRAPEVRNWILVGNSAAGCTGMQFWATYMADLHHNRFYNMDIGYDLRFCMRYSVHDNKFYNLMSYNIFNTYITSSTWSDVPTLSPGAYTTSQALIYNNRFSVSQNQTGVYIKGGDTIYIHTNVFEVPNGAVAKRAVFFDNGGQTTSKGCNISNNHLEGDYAEEIYRLRLQANCTVVLAENYVQHTPSTPCYLVTLINESGSNCVIIRDTGNHSGGGDWTLKYAYPSAVTGVAGGNGGFVFQNTMLQGAPSTPAAIQNNANVFLLTGTDTETGYAYTSPITGSNRIKLDARPL